MARLRYNGLNATLGGTGLTSSATSVTFGAALTHSNGTAVPTITGTDYIPLAILDASGHLSEIVWLTAYTTGATTGTIVRGEEGTAGVAHSSGDRVVCAVLAADVGVKYATSRYNSGTIPVTAGTMTVLTNSGGTGGPISVSIPASAGDLLEIGIAAQAADNKGTWLDLNVATFNGSTEVNRVGGTGTIGSIPSWSIRPNDYFPQSATINYVVQAADVVSGAVSLRLLGLVGSTSLPRGIFSTASAPLDFFVKNLGQPG